MDYRLIINSTKEFRKEINLYSQFDEVERTSDNTEGRISKRGKKVSKESRRVLWNFMREFGKEVHRDPQYFFTPLMNFFYESLRKRMV